MNVQQTEGESTIATSESTAVRPFSSKAVTEDNSTEICCRANALRYFRSVSQHIIKKHQNAFYRWNFVYAKCTSQTQQIPTNMFRTDFRESHQKWRIQWKRLFLNFLQGLFGLVRFLQNIALFCNRHAEVSQCRVFTKYVVQTKALLITVPGEALHERRVANRCHQRKDIWLTTHE